MIKKITHDLLLDFILKNTDGKFPFLLVLADAGCEQLELGQERVLVNVSTAAFGVKKTQINAKEKRKNDRSSSGRPPQTVDYDKCDKQTGNCGLFGRLAAY